MHFDRLVHAAGRLVTSLTCRYAARKVRGIGRVVALGPFNNDQKPVHAHSPSLRLPEPGLLQDAVQSARRQIISRMARNGNSAGLCGVLVLPVAPLDRDMYHPSSWMSLITSRIFIFGSSRPDGEILAYLDTVGAAARTPPGLPRHA